ncbi:MAG: hypothetical protein M1823_003294 [Watsoniomyces obsoletus]|nr:MAG: hypothetical protein M1823_003294 [Watsoniomyces obsoletus]
MSPHHHHHPHRPLPNGGLGALKRGDPDKRIASRSCLDRQSSRSSESSAGGSLQPRSREFKLLTMHFPPWMSSRSTHLPPHCSPSSDFLAQLSTHLGVCLPTPLALVSSTLGLLSIASWLFAQLPQIFTNYALGSTSGLSLFFLVEWCLGDTTNLLGAIFTKQATWQIVVAAYYVGVDVVLVGQYAWYTHLKPARRKRRATRSSLRTNTRDGDEDGSTADEMTESARKGLSRIGPTLPVNLDQVLHDHRMASRRSSERSKPNEKDGSPPREPTRIVPATRPMAAPPRSISPLTPPKSLLYLSLLCAVVAAHPSPISSFSKIVEPEVIQETAATIAGRILSWSSTLLYLGSRLPQLYKNHSRQSTSGLSAKLFIAAFFGNLFYSTSLLTNPCAWSDMPAYGGGGWVGPEGNLRGEWVGRALPFWLGAAGVLALDGAVGVQFLMFRDVVEKDIVRDEMGRWRRVRGWMRGWAPTARAFSPSRVRHEEDEALLGSSPGSSTYGSV